MVQYAYGGVNMNLPSEAIDAIWLVRLHPREFDGYTDQHLCAYLIKKFPTLRDSLSTPRINEIYLHLGASNEGVLRYEELGVMSPRAAADKRKSMVAFMQQ